MRAIARWAAALQAVSFDALPGLLSAMPAALMLPPRLRLICAPFARRHFSAKIPSISHCGCACLFTASPLSLQVLHAFIATMRSGSLISCRFYRDDTETVAKLSTCLMRDIYTQRDRLMLSSASDTLIC